VDLPAIFDDLMENLRVRYVITYKSTSDPNVNRARTVRVELVDSCCGGKRQPVNQLADALSEAQATLDTYILCRAK